MSDAIDKAIEAASQPSITMITVPLQIRSNGRTAVLQIPADLTGGRPAVLQIPADLTGVELLELISWLTSPNGLNAFLVQAGASPRARLVLPQ